MGGEVFVLEVRSVEEGVSVRETMNPLESALCRRLGDVLVGDDKWLREVSRRGKGWRRMLDENGS